MRIVDNKNDQKKWVYAYSFGQFIWFNNLLIS